MCSFISSLILLPRCSPLRYQKTIAILRAIPKCTLTDATNTGCVHAHHTLGTVHHGQATLKKTDQLLAYYLVSRCIHDGTEAVTYGTNKRLGERIIRKGGSPLMWVVSEGMFKELTFELSAEE